MFDKFGEFDSVEELNQAAAGFKAEGDMESLYALAEENGIDREDAEDYEVGATDELATLMMAACGRIKLERMTHKSSIPINVILAMTSGMLDDPEIQRGIMKKGKRVEKILGAMRNAAERHKQGNTGMCCGTDKQLRDIIRAYYTMTHMDFEGKVEDLYKEATA